LSRTPFAATTMLGGYFMRQWFCLSGPAMEEALHDAPLFCEFARVAPGQAPLSDERTI